MDNQVPPHFHKDYPIDERDLIPNGDYVSVVPDWMAPEGTRVHYLNGSDYREYIMLNGAWRVTTNATTAGITFDSVQAATAAGGATSTTSITVTGDDPILFLAVAGFGGDAPTTPPTYNGVAFTLIDTSTVTGTGWICYLYVLRGPTTGTHDISITMSGSHGDLAIAASYQRTDQSSQPDASAKSGPTTTTHYTQSVTSVTDDCWAVMAGIYDTGLTITPDAGTIVRLVTGGALYLCDSGVPKTPAGSITLGLNSSSQPFTGVIAAFKPN